jgi:hypothetical protein
MDTELKIIMYDELLNTQNIRIKRNVASLNVLVEAYQTIDDTHFCTAYLGKNDGSFSQLTIYFQKNCLFYNDIIEKVTHYLHKHNNSEVINYFKKTRGQTHKPLRIIKEVTDNHAFYYLVLKKNYIEQDKPKKPLKTTTLTECDICYESNVNSYTSFLFYPFLLFVEVLMPYFYAYVNPVILETGI